MEQNRGRILLVDDEPALLKMMSVYLGRLGYQVATAPATEKAWSEFESDPGSFAVAVLDASMPGLTMEELALRLLSANRTLRLIAASGYPVDMTAIEAAAPGRTMFLQKPFGPERLAAAVRRMIAAQEEAV